MQPDPSAEGSTAELERANGETLPDPPRRAFDKDGLHVTPSSPRPRDLGLHALVSSARHELRSPLQSIQGFAELLAAESYGALGKDQRVFVEHIIHSTLDLSRALDACFDLIQVEVLKVPSAPRAVDLQTALNTAVGPVQNSGARAIEMRLGQLEPQLCVEVDVLDFHKAVTAVITALAPLMRGSLVIGVVRRGASVELTFGPGSDESRTTLRELREHTRRGTSSRALLWLRLASALLEPGGALLEASDNYERVRILLPVAPTPVRI